MYEFDINLNSSELEPDGLPPIVSLWDLIQEHIEDQEKWEQEVAELLAMDFKRAIENDRARCESDKTPVYVFESIDGYHAINCGFRGERMSKPSFLLDDGFLLPYLKEHPESLSINMGWMPIGYEPSPVIFVYDFLNDELASEFLQVLERAEIKYFLQDAYEVRDLIYSTTPQEVAREIEKQKSPDYESRETSERGCALWLS